MSQNNHNPGLHGWVGHFLSAIIGAVAVLISALITSGGLPLISQSNRVKSLESELKSTETRLTEVQTALNKERSEGKSEILRYFLQLMRLNYNSITEFKQEVGVLNHKADKALAINTINRELKNFIIDVEFMNPYSSLENKWSYGVGFRSTGGNDQYRVFLKSDQTWEFWLYNGDHNNHKFIANGKLDKLNISATDTNKISLFVSDNIGFLFVNDQLISKLDVAEKDKPGDIFIGIEFDGNEVDYKTTRYKNLSVWKLP